MIQHPWPGPVPGTAGYAAVHADVSMQEDYDAAQRIARLRAVHRGRRQRVECRWELTRRSIDAERLWRVRDADMHAWAVLVRAEELADARSIFAYPALPGASGKLPPPVPWRSVLDEIVLGRPHAPRWAPGPASSGQA